MEKFLNYKLSNWFNYRPSHFRTIRSNQSCDLIGITTNSSSTLLNNSKEFVFYISCICLNNDCCDLVKNLEKYYYLFKYPETYNSVDEAKQNIDNFLNRIDKLKGFI